jgi:hypothetical protein
MAPHNLTVPLVRIVDEVLSEVAVGDPVQLEDHGSTIVAEVEEGTLGYVPPHFETPVREAGFTRGQIKSLDRSVPRVTVVLFT